MLWRALIRYISFSTFAATRARGRIGPDTSPCGRTPNNVCNSRRQAEPSLRMDCRWVCVLRRPRASSVRTCAPPEPFLLPTEPGCGICPRAELMVAHSADKPTAEDIRIDVPVRCTHDIGSTCSSSSRHRCSGSRVEPSKRLVREYVERRHSAEGRHPAEVERVEPVKQRTISSKGEHVAFCIRRDPPTASPIAA